VQQGALGRSYTIGGENEASNLELVQMICGILDVQKPSDRPYADLITFVTDRPGHDARYAIDPTRIRKELGWQPSVGYLRAGLVFFAAILMHLILDTIGGGIAWAAPFDMRLIEWVTVPATQSHWILSFLLHWTFALEMVIWAIAGALLWKKMKGNTV